MCWFNKILVLNDYYVFFYLFENLFWVNKLNVVLCVILFGMINFVILLIVYL